MSELWLGRYVDPETISENTAFRVVAAVDAHTAQRLVVVVTTEQSQPEPAVREGRSALSRAGRSATPDHTARAPAGGP